MWANRQVKDRSERLMQLSHFVIVYLQWLMQLAPTSWCDLRWCKKMLSRSRVAGKTAGAHMCPES